MQKLSQEVVTGWAVALTCYISLGEWQISTPHGAKTLKAILMKLVIVDS